MRRAPLIVMLAILAVAIWGGMFLADRPIASSDLPGTYVADPVTIRDMHGRMNLVAQSHQIVLRPDGTFTMTNVPDFWQLSNSPTAMLSCSGQWQLGPRSVELDYTGAELSPANRVPPTLYRAALRTSYHASLEIRGLIPPYKLAVILGDPDEGHEAVFSKSK
jgi:hypothetical protein